MGTTRTRICAMSWIDCRLTQPVALQNCCPIAGRLQARLPEPVDPRQDGIAGRLHFDADTVAPTTLTFMARHQSCGATPWRPRRSARRCRASRMGDQSRCRYGRPDSPAPTGVKSRYPTQSQRQLGQGICAGAAGGVLERRPSSKVKSHIYPHFWTRFTFLYGSGCMIAGAIAQRACAWPITA